MSTNEHFLTASIISIIFLILKFIEMRFIVNENKPLKSIIIDTTIVFISTILSLMVMEQFNVGDLIHNIKSVPSVFTGKPDF